MKTTLKSVLTSTAIIASASLTATSVSAATSNELALQGFTGSQSSFKLTRPASAPPGVCTQSRGYARVTGGEEAELLEVFVWGLPKILEVDVSRSRFRELRLACPGILATFIQMPKARVTPGISRTFQQRNLHRRPLTLPFKRKCTIIRQR